MSALTSVDSAALETSLRAAGIDASPRIVEALRAEGMDHAARVALEETERARIEALGRPVYELPFLAGGIDLAALYELADMLHEQGMA
jgi:hypothetical protein